MNIFGLGPGELLLIMVLALIVFGPGKLPEIGQGLGKAIREFRRATDAVTQEFTRELSLDSLTQPQQTQAAPAPAPAPAPTGAEEPHPAAAPATEEPQAAPEPMAAEPQQAETAIATAESSATEAETPTPKRVRRVKMGETENGGAVASSASSASRIRKLRAATRTAASNEETEQSQPPESVEA